MSQVDSFDVSTQAAKSQILHGCDGPVTKFVAIARAIELARSGKFPRVGVDCPVANALYEILEVEESMAE